MFQVLHEEAGDCECTKSLLLQAEQNECLLDLPSYVSSLSKAELNLSGQCEQLRTFFTFVSFPEQNTVRKCQGSR